VPRLGLDAEYAATVLDVILVIERHTTTRRTEGTKQVCARLLKASRKALEVELCDTNQDAIALSGPNKDALNEVELIQAAATKAESGHTGPLSDADVSIFVKLAEREGFEPSNEVTPVTRFPVAPVQPLRHLSSASAACFRRPGRSGDRRRQQ
jgi:hypothetical protein